MASRSGSMRASRVCLCAPSTERGAFRCSMHKKPPRGEAGAMARSASSSSPNSYKSSSLKAILLQMIKRSGHHHHRRKPFQPKPSRFSFINNANTPLLSVN